jgi:hypothetical protein
VFCEVFFSTNGTKGISQHPVKKKEMPRHAIIDLIFFFEKNIEGLMNEFYILFE